MPRSLFVATALFGAGIAWMLLRSPDAGKRPPPIGPAPWAAPAGEVPMPAYDASAPASPGDALAVLQRGHWQLQQGDLWGAVSDLARARAALPERDDACVLLAIAYHQLNLVNDALQLVPCLERAADRGVEAAADLLGELDRSADIEREFRVVTSDHFVASHPVPDVTTEEIGLVLARLERARADVAARLGFASQRLVPLVIYAEEQFEDATDAPHWALGQYDGKIRLGSGALDWSDERLDQVLTHEYAHALVHEIAGARLPAWFNEGLANSLTAPRDDADALEADLRQRSFQLSIAALSETFARLPLDEAEAAYRQAYWMTRNLVHEGGWDAVSDLLGGLEADPGLAFEDAFIEVYGETQPGYLERWYDLTLGD